MKLLLYCTKAKPYLMKYNDSKYKEIASFYNKQDLATCDLLNGKIVAECDFEVHKFKTLNRTIEDYKKFNRNDMLYIFERSNLSYTELIDYLGVNSIGYAIQIKNLHIFDEPRKLSNYHISYFNKEFNMMREKHIEKAPQNMCRAFDIKDTYILISIQPQWLCKILNGEKTIEIRKKVLKEMLK